MLVPVQCPFCFEVSSITVFVEDGLEQQFTTDCEVCCHPMDLNVRFEEDAEDMEPFVTVDRSDGF